MTEDKITLSHKSRTPFVAVICTCGESLGAFPPGAVATCSCGRTKTAPNVDLFHSVQRNLDNTLNKPPGSS